MQRRIDEGAERAGRGPAEIRRAYNLSGRIGDGGDGPLDGPVSKWVEELSRLALDLGMDTFIYGPRENHTRQVEVFAQEVAPAVRETVAAERSE